MHIHSTPTRIDDAWLERELQLEREQGGCFDVPIDQVQRYSTPCGPPAPKWPPCVDCGRLTPRTAGRRLRWPGRRRYLYLCPDCLPERIERRLALPVTCRDCGETKPGEAFNIEHRPGQHPIRVPQCKDCRSWAMRKRNYGISRKQYNDLMLLQGGVCAICGEPPRTARGGRLYVDHCHATGAVRGLLCPGCNSALGKIGDDPERLRRAAAYVERGRVATRPTPM